MAIRHESGQDDAEDQGEPTAPTTESDPAADISIATSSGRDGGPRTAKGKRRSSGNAIKHGVYSKLPLIGDEQEKDRAMIMKGMLESFQPGNWNERSIVEAMGQNRWQRRRAERWMHEKLKLQEQSVDHWNRQTMDPEMMDLPDDEAAWFDADPSVAYEVALLLREGPSDRALSWKETSSYLTAFKRRSGVKHPSGWIPATDEGGFPDLVPTVAQLLEGVDLAAKAAGCTRAKMLVMIEDEIRVAIVNRVQRRNDDHHRREIELVDALALREPDFAYYERWVNLLEREYDRLFKRLETAQRARGGTLPPPIRLHHSEE
jgi:hypothetical protein